MNVLKNRKQYFENEEDWELFLKGFKDCVFAKTFEEFDDIVKEWKEQFHWNNGNPHTTGPNPTPEEVQRLCREGGTTTTSRLEDAHHVLKCWIALPRKDLRGVWSAVKLAIDHQLSEIRTYRAQQRSGTRISLMSEVFSGLRGHITPYALSKLHKQWTIFKSEERVTAEERQALPVFAQGVIGARWEFPVGI